MILQTGSVVKQKISSVGPGLKGVIGRVFILFTHVGAWVTVLGRTRSARAGTRIRSTRNGGFILGVVI